LNVAKYNYPFPELGEGLHEGEIIKVHIKVGDKVTDEDIIMEVQNDKAVVEVPCPVNGTVLEVLAKDGDVFRVGQTVAVIDAEGDVPVHEGGHAEEHGSQEADAAKGSADTTSSPAASSPADAKEGGAAAGSVPAPDRDVLATPSVRKFAREQGVDISKVNGSGKGGKITREDVEAFQNGGSAAAAADSAEAPKAEAKSAPAAASTGNVSLEEERVPFKGIRKAISNAMVKSAYTAPHVTIMDEVDVTEL
jgi:pyruvate dehydrogenase E2 component (dihydrolipoamide acetyltransferase)